MTFADFQLCVAYGGAFSFLALIVVRIVAWAWCHEIVRRGLKFTIGFSVAALAVTATRANKPPRPPVVSSMNLHLDRFDAKGFDVSWDYGGLTPADFRDGENVKLTAEFECLDYILQLATVPVTVTNYHVNAIARGLPRDWMRHNLKVTARCNNLLGTAINDGGDSNELPSINDANGGDE